MKIEISKMTIIKIEIDISFHETGETRMLYDSIIYYVKDILKSAHINNEFQSEYNLATHIVVITITLPNSGKIPLCLSKVVHYLITFDRLGH